MYTFQKVVQKFITAPDLGPDRFPHEDSDFFLFPVTWEMTAEAGTLVWMLQKILTTSPLEGIIGFSHC